VDETKREEYLIGLTDTISVAKKLGCSKLITQTGNALNNIPWKTISKFSKGLESLCACLRRE